LYLQAALLFYFSQQYINLDKVGYSCCSLLKQIYFSLNFCQRQYVNDLWKDMSKKTVWLAKVILLTSDKEIGILGSCQQKSQ
jgi:hypothetical protein